ncbi:T9SS type A sorting domain-containing protein [Winogradskyella sp. A2]|uniref:T9SS type A sorting domain-containing protein n=1 Tax=Winogradskyella sp. A2 TaxID=3366944 RepID=UPI00398C6769
MKKLYFLLFTIISFASYGQIINEFQPNAVGADPDPMSIELKGTPSASFSGYLISIESDGNNGSVDRSAAVSGTFDANGLLVVMIPDLENPSFTFALCESDPGIGTDLDSDNDGTFEDLSSLGTIYDAIGIPDNTGDAVVTASYASQLGGVSFDYTGDEPGLVFRDGASDDWFALNEPFDGTSVYDITATIVQATDFDSAPALTGTFGSVNPIYTMPTEPTLTLVDGPVSGSTLDLSPEDLTGDLEFATTNFVVGEPGTASEGDGYISWVVDLQGGGVHDSGDIYDTSLTYPLTPLVGGNTYILTAELLDNSGVSLSPAIVYTLTVNANAYNVVADIAALRAGTQGEYYEVTGEVYGTYQQDFRNQKFIQDATGGILIDDTDGVITTVYVEGDGVLSVKGQLGEFNGMMQLVPTVDPGTPNSTGNIVTPQAVSLLDLATNPEDYESELVIVSNVTMDNSTPIFSGGSVHAMDQGGDMFNFRSTFFSADYADQGYDVPTIATDIIGIINERSGNTYFLTARGSFDFSVPLSTDSFETNLFSLYPNPTNMGSVTISSNNSEAMDVQVFDVLGKEVINKRLANNNLDVSNLRSGLYIVKITQNSASVTKKLVIK